MGFGEQGGQCELQQGETADLIKFSELVVQPSCLVPAVT